MTPAPGRDDTTGAGDEPLAETLWNALPRTSGFYNEMTRGDAEHLARAVVAAGWTQPAATPGRGELREQIAAALHEQSCTANPGHADWTNCAIDGPCFEDADAVMEPVDAWVAAHTAEDAAVSALCERMTALNAKNSAAVARVRALCDDAAAESRSHDARTHDTTPYIPVAAVRAVLPPTEQT